MPVLIGVAALGTEGAQVLTLHRQAQAAADLAAVSVASYYAAQYTKYAADLSGTLPTQPTQTNLAAQAQAVAANYGFVDGTNGVAVTMHNPPTSGNFTNPTTYPYAFEVIVSQPHSPLLSSYWLPSGMTVKARAVAVINVANGSNANCILALGKSSAGTANLANAITGTNSATVNLTGCSVGTNSDSTSSITLTNSSHINLVKVSGHLAGRASTVGEYSFVNSSSAQSCTSITGSACNGAINVTPSTSAAATPDPYAGVTIPSASACLAVPSADKCAGGKPGWCIGGSSTLTLNPGTYCGGISISNSATVTMNPGVYVLASQAQNETGLSMVNSASLTGNGVTLVFTSEDGTYPPSTPPMMDIVNSSSISLTAPTSGATAGFVIMGDRSMPLGTTSSSGSQFVVVNSGTGALGGVVYLPNGAFRFTNSAGATTPCTQVVANVIDLVNSATLNINCSGSSASTTPSTLIGSIPLLVE